MGNFFEKLNSSSSDINTNDKIKLTTKDISVINEELELKSKDSFSTEIKEQQKTEENNLNINSTIIDLKDC